MDLYQMQVNIEDSGEEILHVCRVTWAIYCTQNATRPQIAKCSLYLNINLCIVITYFEILELQG